MEERTCTANDDRDLWTLIIDTRTSAQEEAEVRAGETRSISSREVLMESLRSTPFQWMARRQAGLNMWIGRIATLIDLEQGHC